MTTGYAGSEFRNKYRDEPTLPIIAYTEGKKEGLYGFPLEPIVATEQIGRYTMEDILKLRLRYEKRYSGSFCSNFSSLKNHLVRVAKGLTLTYGVKKPTLIVHRIDVSDHSKDQEIVCFPQHVNTEKNDWNFFCAGNAVGEMIRKTKKNRTIHSLSSNYESLLSRYGQTWDSLLGIDLKSLGKMAGEMEYIDNKVYLENRLEKEIDGSETEDLATANDITGSYRPVVMSFKNSIEMFRLAEDEKMAKTAERDLENYNKRIIPVIKRIQRHFKFMGV